MSSTNVLGYYRNLSSLRYENEYCVERRCMGKTHFFLFNWSFYNHSVVPALCSPQKWAVPLAMYAAASPSEATEACRKALYKCNKLLLLLLFDRFLRRKGHGTGCWYGGDVRWKERFPENTNVIVHRIFYLNGLVFCHKLVKETDRQMQVKR